VDFWDLTKLLLRRWYFALPMLALTAAAGVWIISSVQPNYIATAYVQLIPPKTQPTPAGTAGIDMRNPWTGLGLITLANAAIVTVGDKDVVEALAEGGFSETYTVTVAPQSPLVKFEITGSTPEQASATAEALVERYQQILKDLQQRDYRVEDKDLIGTTRLDHGNNLTESDAKVKRALVGVVGAGLLITIAMTVGLDALIRLRARRRAGMAAADMPPAAVPAERPATQLFEQLGATANGPSYPGANPAVRTFQDMPTAGTPSAGNGGGAEASATVSYQTRAEPRPSEPANPAEGPTEVTVISPDATVVLPLSNNILRRREQAKNEGSPPR
jgi:capsular polysaccharide biosynthesis protein